MYAVRIDLGSVSEEQVADWLCDLDTGHFAVREGDPENPHIHAIVCTSMLIRSFRNKFLRAFPNLSGNGSYSITAVKDEDKYNRYMCKGAGEGSPPRIVSKNGLLYTEDWAEEQHRRYYEEAPKLSRGKKRLIDVVYDTCKEAAIDWHDRQAIARVYIKECMSRNQSINTFQAKGAVNLVQCKLCPTDAAIEDLINGI